MDKTHVIKVVSEVLIEIQRDSGRESLEISHEMCPIGDLPGFDSLNGVEATVELADRLGFDLPGINTFVSEDGTKALSVSQIAANICNAALSKGS